jgi:anthranilate synthase/aminodeoxychorismate synthase-like glutamine amidotransferase
MTLVIDNYDSFTYNLVQLLGTMTPDILVHRNDEVSVDDILANPPDRILISPGPGRPEDAGITLELVHRCAERVPILGVCLGHQAIGSAFGGNVVHAPSLMHGRTSPIVHYGSSLFRSIPAPFEATRYHSLVISRENFPPDLEITAETTDGVIMGVRHRSLPIHGVQFHPESILTVHGRQLLSNWLEAEA